MPAPCEEAVTESQKQSLAEQWNRQALKALKVMADEEPTGEDAHVSSAWAHKVLEDCRKSLRDCFGEAPM